MTVEVSERSLEEAIECGLLQHGPDACAEDATDFGTPPQPPHGDGASGFYRKRRPEDYDRVLCLLPRDVTDFILATQPKEWEKFARREQFLDVGSRLRNPVFNRSLGAQRSDQPGSAGLLSLPVTSITR
jgi:hypothetical protein